MYNFSGLVAKDAFLCFMEVARLSSILLTMWMCITIEATKKLEIKSTFQARDFMDEDKPYKWTVFGTNDDENIVCKVDVVESLEPTKVLFTRYYKENGEQYSKKLRGDFYGSYMAVYEGDTSSGTSSYQFENLIYMDSNRICAIFKTVLGSQGGNKDANVQVSTCEARIRTDKTPTPDEPDEYPDCFKYFKEYCSPYQPRYDVYRNTCTVPSSQDSITG